MRAYYDARAPEYDDWYEGRGRFADRERPGFAVDLAALRRALAALPPARTLDVACGTGYLTRDLPGTVVALDQSARMLAVAGPRLGNVELVHGDALALPFDDGSFDRIFAGHFYGHLEPPERERFLREARRVARQLVVADASPADAGGDEEWQERILDDGSRWRVYKRYFAPERLVAELGGGRTLHVGRYFLLVASP